MSLRLTPGGSAVPRPDAIEPCRACGAPLGAGYPDCPACHDAVEALWDADWRTALEERGIPERTPEETAFAQRVVDDPAGYPWTVLDAAATRLRCTACGAPRGGGATTCETCAFDFGNLFGIDDSDLPQPVHLPGYRALAPLNGHALRVGRWVLRFAHRHSTATVAGWRSNYPLLLTGGLPTTREAQAGRVWLNNHPEEAERLARPPSRR